MAWAIRQQETTDAAARHVLLCLANYAGADGRNCFPSAATLSRDTGLSERTIRYKLDALLQLGLIRPGNQAVVAAECARADRRPVNYDLALERGAADAPRRESPTYPQRGAKPAPREGERGATDDTTGCKRRQNGVQELHPNRSLSINEPQGQSVNDIHKGKSNSEKPKRNPREAEHLQSIQELLSTGAGVLQ